LATFKKIEVVGTSSKSVADAIKSAVSGAGKTLRNMSWFEVAEIRGAIKGGEVSEFQVTVGRRGLGVPGDCKDRLQGRELSEPTT